MGSFLENHQDCDNKNDLISKLPDGILSHILSFLPFKFATRTSVLAHRWKYLWKSVPDIEFTCHPDQTENESKTFVCTVDQVLSLRGIAQIRKFKLSFYSAGVTGLSCITSWIQHAVQHNVREIDLNVMDDDELIVLPPELFTCKTLVFLKLQSGWTFNVPSLIHFPCLKVLHVISDVSEEIAERLFSGCPVLEELLIEGYKEDHITVNLNIVAPVLKKLNIYFETSIEDQVVIDAPKCKYLCIDFTAKPVVKSLSSVTEAYVSFGNCFGRPDGHNWDYSEYVIQLLEKISNVQILIMSALTVFAIRCALHHNLSPFPNLLHLRLAVENCVDWQFLPGLLDNSPNLESLLLEKSTHCNHLREHDWSSPESVPQCLKSNLNYFYFVGFNGRKDELKMIEFFLQTGEVLKELTINSLGLLLEDGEALMNAVLMLPRASQTCCVRFLKD